MELKEFVKETLIQIADGVKEAIEETKNEEYNINPAKEMKPDVQTIRFSVMVETSHKGGVNIKIAEAGGSVINVNRIEFDIKMTLPCTNDSRQEMNPPRRIPISVG